jgi:precorrin-3B synthase
MTAQLAAVPERRGICPGLSTPLPTGDGLLVRLIPIGTVSLGAFGALAVAALRHGNGIVEITARGSIQLRGLTEESAILLARDVGTLGIAAEDGVPILCNPLAGLQSEEIFDAPALAAAVRRALAGSSLTERLAPKCSVVIDSGGSPDLAQIPADIRLRAQWVNGEPALCIAAGGNEADAIDLGPIAPERAVECVLRLLALLAQRGRGVRARDLIAAGGASVLRDALASARDGPMAQSRRVAVKSFDSDAAQPQARSAIGLHRLPHGSLACGIGLAFGHADATALEKLVDAAAKAGACGLRIAPDRALLAIGLSAQGVAALIAAAEQLGFVTKAGDPRRFVFACAGAPLCASGHIAARAMAPHIATTAAPYLREGSIVHVSGCAKGCAHPAVASLTVVGTAGNCALIENGSARDAPCATACVDDLPAAIARHLREQGVDHV